MDATCFLIVSRWAGALVGRRGAAEPSLRTPHHLSAPFPSLRLSLPLSPSLSLSLYIYAPSNAPHHRSHRPTERSSRATRQLSCSVPSAEASRPCQRFHRWRPPPTWRLQTSMRQGRASRVGGRRDEKRGGRQPALSGRRSSVGGARARSKGDALAAAVLDRCRHSVDISKFHIV